MSIESARARIREAKAKNSSELNLFYIRLTDNDFAELIPEIKTLKGLTSLSLSRTKLTSYKILKELPNLTSLDLSGNQLTNVEFLKDLPNLTGLDLSGNQLTNGASLKDLPNLVWLNLNLNNLTNADFLKDLPNLKTLNLSVNNLTNVEFLKDLKKLTKLDLGKNDNLPNFGIDSLWGLDKEKIQKIVKFYEDLAEQGKDYIYEAKVLLIGQPRAGKTTLRRKMLNPQFQPKKATEGEKRSTLAIEVETFPFPIKTQKGEEKEFTSYLWDFGGQDIQYVLHQYFLTERSLYVFLYEVGKEDEKTNYWFEIIAALGKNCPVLVVLNYNQIEKTRPSNFSIDTYRKEFADKIKDISERKVDFAVNDVDWENLYQTIKDKVSTLEHIGRDFLPKKTVDIRNLLSRLEKPIISLDDYYELCQKHKIEDEEANTILTRLHDFGVALWYQNDDNLKHKVILKPNWVIDALYVVLKEDCIQKNNGKFCSETIYKLWENYRYEEKVFLLSLMQKGVFSTAYKLQNVENWYIVPALLSEDRPSYEFNEQNSIQIYYEYNFLPEGIISRLIVELNEKIHSQKGEQIVWKKGVLFESKNSVAEVVQSARDRRITIKVSGKDKFENKELLSDIRKEIEKIHRQVFKNRLTVSEFVPCPCNICNERRINFEKLSPEEIRNLTEERKKEYETDSFKFTDLINRLYNLKRLTIECRKSAIDLNVQDLLGEIYIESKIRGERENMSSQDTYNFYGNTQLNKDNATGTQNNYQNNSKELMDKFDSLFAKIDEKNSQMMEAISNLAMNKVRENISVLTKEEQSAFEEVKKGKWETKLKFVIPLIPKIPFLGEFFPSASIETARTITSDEYIKFVRDKFYGGDLQTNILETKSEPKGFLD